MRYPATNAPDLPLQALSQTLEIDHRCFAVTSEGHRVLSQSKSRVDGSCVGPWEVAREHLPPLASVEASEGRFVFVTLDANLYTSSSPLGDVEKLPTDAKRRKAVVGSPLAVGVDGSLDHLVGTSWSTVSLPTGMSIDDAVVSPFGIFALGIPESLWESTDGGSHFERARSTSTESFGLRSIEYDAATERVIAFGSLGRRSRTARTIFGPDDVPPSAQPDEVDLGFAPHAGELGVRASLDGRRYRELRETRGATHEWRLATGEIGGELEVRTMALLASCTDAWLAAHGHTVAVGCETAGDRKHITLFGSVDDGKTFGDWGSIDGPETPRWVLGVPAEGTVVVSHHDRPSIATRLPAGLITETASGPVDAVAVGANGRVAFVGQRASDLVVVTGTASPDGLELGRPSTIKDLAFEGFCSPPALDKSGVLGVCMRGVADLRWVTVPPSGHPVMTVLPPETRAAAGAGMRVLIDRGEDLRLSLDGGLAFEPIATKPGNLGVMACDTDACLLDPGLVWLGWDTAEVPLLEAPPTLAELPVRHAIPLGAPLVCTVPENEKREQVYEVETHYLPFPQLSEMARDGTLFELTTNAPGHERERVFASLDMPVPSVKRAAATTSTPQVARWTLSPRTSAPTFARRSVEQHAVPGGGSAEVELATVYSGDIYGYHHFVSYAWVDPATGASHAETLAARTQASFTRRGEELGVLFAPFRWDAPDRSWDDATYRAVRDDGSLAEPISAPSVEAFSKAPKKCPPAVRSSTPRIEYTYGSPVSGAGRMPVLLRDSTGQSWGLADGVVLHGTTSAPCGAALRATGSSWVVAVDGALQRGVVFYLGARASPISKSAVVQRIRCSRDTSVSVPTQLSEGSESTSWSTRTSPPGKL